MITSLKQKKIKLKPSIKLSHNITVIVFPLISAFPSSPTPLVKSAKIVPHYTPLKFVNRKTTPTKPCSLVPVALKEICPGNEVYTIIILGVGVGVRGGGVRLIGIVTGEIVASKV